MDPAAAPFQPGVLEMSLLGVGAVLGLISLICFVFVLVKMFQNNDTAIGVVTIVTFCFGIGQFVALIFGWMKAREWNIKGLMVTYTIALLGSMLIGGAGYGIMIAKLVNNPEFQQMQQQMQQQMEQDMQGLEGGIEIEVPEEVNQ